MVILHLPKDEEIVDFEKLVLGQAYRFTDRAFIREALQGPSIYNHDGQKTLALVGDAILRQSLVEQGRERSETPEEIQNVITKVASNINLYYRGIALGLDPFIVKNPGQLGITAGRKTMATTMEAIIGAVFYDSAKNGDDLKRVLIALGLAWPE
ncbi:hypothetical protein E8E15_008299 [Penicillium rubens]|uniref:Pc12g01930 protein n=2 Tax=Penicillium chrysogenum species complex TaxID=254878 RepID=B6GZD6_PENRW|nr:uncharacterized protein N7525_002259 [Penicillium rubens]KZN84553.1 hypothetical protein EN45_086930 [Penicillium chrysogenum]CAP79820.1 Pc12g01930 [Penicillium rubens Wisconsin 54-1255]KAF3020878.1 hypothetical protein E8E15_008299 [Penicillium rubens]KAJ5844518.1 hypothetical protein N7525_002259 [Penicillium rubens]KAJ5844891.1 hypothetical protein N7534_008560 [Penicillium rubens]